MINLQKQKEVEYEEVRSFFTPKLTNEELKLVQEGNEEHMKTYFNYLDGKNPDVDVGEMKKSDSRSKYVHGQCSRITIPLTPIGNILGPSPSVIFGNKIQKSFLL